ncbi:MAG: ABC transporter permease [Phycisphaerae bacterium]|nr:MAG: ABC transporter permease [Planctomycetota bacterium]KAB2941342.1 MAG: ABC transporter permease [Phycisphaerae bacterium]MBE7455810.1 ABC transporter permease [Planctomycetia bacterium]MCK6463445.1 ABC transporter permease [Phycisphaerae bacterium]MCL4717068.1 ABC transporter permease [Phycisphaerae bacterium]
MRQASTRVLSLTAGGWAPAAALILVITLGFVFHGDRAYFNWNTHRDAMRQASVYGILACGMTAVILAGGIDLSVGSVLALVSVAFSMMSLHRQDSAAMTIPAALMIGAACGGVSGALIAFGRIQPFIVTLAMMVAARGLAKALCGGVKVSRYIQDADGRYIALPVPEAFSRIDARLLGGNIAVVTVIFLACVLVCHVALTRTTWGRRVYALGGNEEASRLSGVPTRMMKVSVYALSGACAAVAGICQAAQLQQGDPEDGAGYELSAIAMVVIGGTRLSGGRGGIGLTLIGVLIVGYIEKILSINNVPEYARLMFTGAIILAAVLLQRRWHPDSEGRG